MALMHSKMIALGSKAVDFSLPGTNGNLYSLGSFEENKILILIFMCNHCPYVKAVFDRLNSLQEDYGVRGVQLVGINANDATNYPDDSFEMMKKEVEKRGIRYPYLYDETQETAKAYDAVCTPDLYLYGPERTLLYRGRIDDNWQDPSAVTKKDLREAIEAVLEQREVSSDQIPSMGCSIKWKK